MSMTATFIQVDEADLARLQADESLAEALFTEDSGLGGSSGRPTIPPVFANLTAAMQDRVRAGGPKLMADVLARMDPRLRQQIEARLGWTAEALAKGEGGGDILHLMQERAARSANRALPVEKRAVLELDKAWHGVHYVLCGQAEPGPGLLSQVVMGGTDIGDDDEGFSGYGPARYFSAARVAQISEALSQSEVESEAAARFDAERMSRLHIYPGWRVSDAEWLMDAFRRLRGFYGDAAANRRPLITCVL